MQSNNNVIWVRTYIYKKKVAIDSILFCKIVDNRIEIYLCPGGKLEGIHHSLKDLEDMLPPNRFFRCNRQFIINVEQVDSYSETILEVILNNGEKIPIAKEKKDELKRLLEG